MDRALNGGRGDGWACRGAGGWERERSTGEGVRDRRTTGVRSWQVLLVHLEDHLDPAVPGAAGQGVVRGDEAARTTGAQGQRRGQRRMRPAKVVADREGSRQGEVLVECQRPRAIGAADDRDAAHLEQIVHGRIQLGTRGAAQLRAAQGELHNDRARELRCRRRDGLHGGGRYGFGRGG